MKKPKKTCKSLDELYRDEIDKGEMEEMGENISSAKKKMGEAPTKPSIAPKKKKAPFKLNRSLDDIYRDEIAKCATEGDSKLQAKGKKKKLVTDNKV